MSRPDRDPRDLVRLLAEMRQEIERSRRREAFSNKREQIANAGGLHALAVPLIAPDASGWYSVTTSAFVSLAAFVGAPYAKFWAIVAGNGSGADWTFQVTYPAQADRVLGVSTFFETHPTLGPLHRVECALDADLDAATTAYDNTVVLQAKTANSTNSNKARLIAAGWGSPNV